MLFYIGVFETLRYVKRTADLNVDYSMTVILSFRPSLAFHSSDNLHIYVLICILKSFVVFLYFLWLLYFTVVISRDLSRPPGGYNPLVFIQHP